jgi:hypothetical protein
MFAELHAQAETATRLLTDQRARQPWWRRLIWF